MEEQTTFETVTELRAAYTNDFRVFTKCADKYAHKIEPFLRWKIENFEDTALWRALYDLEDEMWCFEDGHNCRLSKPIELTMLKREFYKRTGLKWDEAHVEYDEVRYGNYSSINSYTIREIKILEDRIGMYMPDEYYSQDDDYIEGDGNMEDDEECWV